MTPQLTDQLKAEGVKTVVMFGIQSDFWVRATSKGALAAGFEVIVIKGAHSTYGVTGKTAEEMERIGEDELRRKGGRNFAVGKLDPVF